MQTHTKLETSVGLFVMVGASALAYLSFTLGGLEVADPRYDLHARFSSVGDLKRGDAVKLAGVHIGEVSEIGLVDYTASVRLSVSRSIAVPKDSIASVQTAGLLGDAYVSLSAGASADNLPEGGSIGRTEPAISISELLAKYAFGSLDTDAPSQTPPSSAGSEPPSLDVLQ
jgi:phospholipid/cholesterol/gamma-HCH transport system substrate-binding protein